MNGEVILTVSQALQVVALMPTLFVMMFLLFTARKAEQIIVPELYFFALCCSFILPLLPLFQVDPNSAGVGALLFGESLVGALSFLLIIQFLLGRLPPFSYWMILAIPVIGGSGLVYGTVVVDEICVGSGRDFCASSQSLKTLYGIFSSSLIFLLLMANFSRKELGIPKADPHRAHKYWLVMALILLNLQLLLVDLGGLASRISADDVLFASTLLRLAFIYLVLTSLFRVFDQTVEIDVSRIATIAPKPKPVTEQEQALAQRIKALIEEKKLHREMGLAREGLAKELGVSEHQLSRVINQVFQKNFSEFVNSYRVDEAKRRLSQEEASITVIAFEVGFNSIASFNRVFKESTGQSPTEYRTANKA